MALRSKFDLVGKASTMFMTYAVVVRCYETARVRRYVVGVVDSPSKGSLDGDVYPELAAREVPALRGWSPTRKRTLGSRPCDRHSQPQRSAPRPLGSDHARSTSATCSVTAGTGTAHTRL